MKHLKKINVLIQLSDGSSINICCFNYKREFLYEYDLRFDLTFYSNINSLEELISKKKKFDLYKYKI